jgi:alginate O-acetyltransferase complex protein AlgI
MSFTSLIFFPFFFGYLGLSALLRQRQWLWLTAIASSFFYGYWEWRFLFLLYYIAAVSWYCGQRIAASSSEKERKFFVTVSIVSCLFVLAVFKYFNFFEDNFTAMARAFGLALSPRLIEIALPVGISFYTFHALSYTIDLYRGKLKKAADFLSITVYLSFFPQLVAGPIVRAHSFLPQIDRGPVYVPRKVMRGLLLIAWGYFLKLCVADSIGLVIDPLFQNISAATSSDLLFAITAYAFQIYGDFAGYSFVAIGLAKLQGFDFPANFLAPYFSKSASEFWRRWHISLSSFLRDYLYFPLGGNRRGRLMEYRNLFITMFLGGLWHGASYNFIIWGMLHGLYLIGQRVMNDAARLLGLRPKRARGNPVTRFLSSAIKMACVFTLVCLAWIFFRLQELPDALRFIGGILSWENVGIIHSKFLVLKVLGLIAVTVIVDAIFIDRRRTVRLLQHPAAVAGAIAMLCVALQLLGTFGGSAFIYFQF